MVLEVAVAAATDFSKPSGVEKAADDNAARVVDVVLDVLGKLKG